MSNPYQLIVFDWEGTISDTLGLILQTVSVEATRLGFGKLDPQVARKYVDFGLVQALRKTYPHLSSKQQEQLLQAVHQAMLTRPTEVCIIPGAKEFIQHVYEAKIDIAIATNKGQQSLARSLQASGLNQWFKVTRSAGQSPAKPCPQMLEEIMEEFGRDETSTLMIGDSSSDMEMAKMIDVDAIGVDFYHQQDSVLRTAGALEVFDNYQSLAKFLGLPKA